MAVRIIFKFQLVSLPNRCYIVFMRLFGRYPLDKLIETFQGHFGVDVQKDESGELSAIRLYLFYIKIEVIPNKNVNFSLLTMQNGKESWHKLITLVAGRND